MRYILCCKIIDKATGKEDDGFCLFDSLGLYPSLFTKEVIDKRLKEDKTLLTLIYDDLEYAQQRVSEMSKAFRRDDVWAASKWIKSKKIRNFYLLKVDSSKFPYKLEKYDKPTKTKGIIYQLLFK